MPGNIPLQPMHTSSVSVADWAMLGRQLDQDHAIAAALIQLLQEERQALAERDYPRFEQLLATKTRHLQCLEQGQQQRRQWLQHTGLPSERAALEQAEIAAPEIAMRWHELAAAWQECQQLNQGNEQIAQRTRLVVNRVLDLLHGNSGGTMLYDATGQTRARGTGQPLGDA